jgi:hypothetical protein
MVVPVAGVSSDTWRTVAVEAPGLARGPSEASACGFSFCDGPAHGFYDSPECTAFAAAVLARW